ncbi:MAG: transcription termination/antitermination NusG family protein [Verrucomicrobiota bacterium]
MAEIESSEQSSWWVAHALPRREKKARDSIAKVAQEVFLPLRTSRREYSSKSVTFEIPLFPGYLFARFPSSSRQAIYQSPHVASLLNVTDQKTFKSQIDELKSLLSRTADVTPCPFIQTGRKVRITSGRFRGIEGVVIRRSKKTHLVLSLDFLQRSIEVELSADLVALAA